jgi:hypothetical protein
VDLADEPVPPTEPVQPTEQAQVAEPVQAPPTAAVAKPKVQTGFTYWPLLADFVARYVVYVAWRQWHLPSGWFWTFQTVLIPLLIFAWLGQREDKLKEVLGVSNSTDYEVKDAPGWIVFMLALMVHNIVHAVSDVRTVDPGHRLGKQVLLAVMAGFYTLMIGVSSSTTERLDQPGESYEAFDAVDENDRILTRIKAELDDFIRKVEAYTIESTLIGAITFAAFVTIVMADKGRFEIAHGLLNSCALASRSAMSLKNWHGALQLVHYPKEGTILVAVALTSVACSLFFMGVMVARLRFSSLVGAASYSTEMAANLNEKENDLSEEELTTGLTDKKEQRLKWLHLHVDQYLNEAKVELEQLRPIIVYMTIFRTLGLLAFMFTLVLSALWFGPRTALCFGVIAILTYCYPWIDAVRDKRLRNTDYFGKLRSVIAKVSAH